ncbi:fumarylacetoacetate hydrolase family protein [Aliidiomarina maris]|uniref:2-keto-4-pentenoate hydratase/2-oxohepta-3-ene-1,7-dioic acid hydratase in catechol pathway n=1 Tax=Aliidiomarina maris TaxID=531312 RepID=A0A327X7F0_9GAMM|nr:fumarylacetoacetate hydrolase family protein [Aliidiomarina maris]RAK01813.1 2-keto-4-pentenoate hydratase/2-oxohepta-3-ene-1,7-dioic acid hydratase in catechol pathway [Aliidiomarina maris]RUO28624.1 isomerase/hydrolase [Aliidiomarina maris]
MTYQHKDYQGRLLPFTPGKVVCVGRNYRAHAEELGNSVPEEPLLFIKPASALQPFSKPIQWPQVLGSCHHELELCLLIGKHLEDPYPKQAMEAIWGYTLGLDLTLRDQQNLLKAKAFPWERAKAFAGSAPMGTFIPAKEIKSVKDFQLELQINGGVRQAGETNAMIFNILELLCEAARTFTLQPGDIIMTGTPAGVGSLRRGDELYLQLQGASKQWSWRTRVAG